MIFLSFILADINVNYLQTLVTKLNLTLSNLFSEKFKSMEHF